LAGGGVWVATNAPHDDRMKSRRFIYWPDTLVYHREASGGGVRLWDWDHVAIFDFALFGAGWVRGGRLGPLLELGSFVRRQLLFPVNDNYSSLPV